MALIDLLRSFGGGSANSTTVTPPVTQPGAPPNSNLVVPQQTNPNPQVPNATTPTPDGSTPGIPKIEGGEKSPLAEYATLWQAGDKTGNTESVTPGMTFDPAKLLETARQVDFTKGLSPELLAKAQSGDQQALLAIINDVGQRSYAGAVGASAEVAKRALEAQATNLLEKRLPELVRQIAIQQTTRQDNPLMSDPAAAPILQALEAQITSKFPQATAQQVKDHMETMVNGIAELAVKQSGGTIVPKRAASPTDRAEMDWEKFMTG